MPSEGAAAITGRCYCGHITLRAETAPETVTYCHCDDCRRLTGAPVAAFAAFPSGTVHLDPDPGPRTPRGPTVQRWFCPKCGSPLAATFDYLPGQIYVPLGVLDQAAELPPESHSHFEAHLPWLEIVDDAPRQTGSNRAALQSAAKG